MTQPAPAPNGCPANKYLRQVRAVDGPSYVTADVYSVLTAFGVTCPAVQHAAKKLLCAGIRGHKGTLQDLTEARQALDRAIQMATDRDTPEATAGPQS